MVRIEKAGRGRKLKRRISALPRGSFVRRIPSRLRVATSCTSFLLRIASCLSFRRDKEKKKGKRKSGREEGRKKILSSGVILALSRATTLVVVVYYRPLCARLANFRHYRSLFSLKINSVCPQAFSKYERIINRRSEMIVT